LWDFNVLPFGLNSGPGLFSELVTEGLQGLEEFSAAYIDDILVTNAVFSLSHSLTLI
jgi:hypothetical protein